MAELQNPDPLVEAVAKARAAVSRRPDEKFPTGRLNYIGKHCYCYSGQVSDSGTSGPNTTAMDFVTNIGTYIVGKFQYEPNHEGSLVIDIVVEFNGVRVYDSEFDASPAHGMWNNPLDIIIPPNTHVRVLWGASAGQDASFQFTGEVFEA